MNKGKEGKTIEGKTSGCLINCILLIGRIIFVFAGVCITYVSIRNHLGLREVTLDYVQNAFFFLIGGVMVVIALIGLIGNSLLNRFLLFQLLCSGILGVFSCVFLRDIAVDKPVIRTDFVEMQNIFLFLLCLGFGMFLFSRRIARIIVLASILGCSVMGIVLFGLSKQYYLVLVSVYLLVLARFFYWKTAAILVITPASFIIISFLSFLNYGRITWCFGFNPAGSRHTSMFPFESLKPSEYIYMSENSEIFYSVVTFNLFLGILLFSLSVWQMLSYYKKKEKKLVDNS